MTLPDPALDVSGLVHRYGTHTALAGLTLRIEPGEIFALLGPNGSGKTTLFRLLSTLMPVSEGTIRVFGHSLPGEASAVRAQLGVVFQNPSCDRKLTVRENLRCQAALYGLKGSAREQRIAEVLGELGLTDRTDWRLEKLSGGLQRRVDIAKSMLHAPRLLILDEPSTGLDPAARLDLWHALVGLRDRHGVTLLLTTHLLEEAEKAERIGILHQGKIVALGRPEELRRELGDRVLVIHAREPERVLAWLRTREIDSEVQQDQLRVAGTRVAELVAPLTAELGDSIRSLSLGEPSLEDVFIARTGHQFWDAAAAGGNA
ncbi:MAG: ATP-binding cassette domain-containing protein [Aureliella sp.]